VRASGKERERATTTIRQRLINISINKQQGRQETKTTTNCARGQNKRLTKQVKSNTMTRIDAVVVDAACPPACVVFFLGPIGGARSDRKSNCKNATRTC